MNRATLGAQVVDYAVTDGFCIPAGIFRVCKVPGVLAIVEECRFDDGCGDAGIIAHVEPAPPTGGIDKSHLNFAFLPFVGHAVVEAPGVE